MNKICVICQKEFKAMGRKVCCSEECSKIKHKQRMKKYMEKYNSIHEGENKQYCLINKEKISQQHKQYYKKNREEILKNIKKWNLKNPQYHNNYRKNKYYNDLSFKLIENTRCRIYTALKNNIKSDITLNLLGCSIQFYKNFLEFQFNKKMSWDNYGSYWEVDHIIPLNTFDLSKLEEQYKAFNYINTRPLEKIKNKSRPKNGCDYEE